MGVGHRMPKNLIPYMQALLDEYKAVQDGRIHRGPIGQEVTVRRDGPGWLIEIYGTEREQRDMLKDNLMTMGIPTGAAEWIAGRCPVTMLPDREIVAAMSALDRLGDGHDEYFSELYFGHRRYKVR